MVNHSQNRECVTEVLGAWLRSPWGDIPNPFFIAFKPQLHIHDAGYDSCRCDLYCKIGMKPKIQKSLQCHTTFLGCLYVCNTIHDGAITVLLW